MPSFNYIAALGALIATVAAVPLKRELIVNTVTEVEVVTDVVTATVWVDATDLPAMHPAQYTAGASEQYTSVAWPATTHALPTTSSSVYVAPVPSSTSMTTSSTSSSLVVSLVYTAPPEPAVPVPATTSTYMAPPPTTTSTSQWVAVTSAYDVPVYTPPVATTPVYTPPAATTPVYTPTAATTTPTTAATSTGSSSAGHSVGEITYYDVGQGSCGNMNSDSEMVVAIPFGIMNKPKMCGSSVTISYQGATHIGQIVDTCMGCQNTDLDLSPALFKAVAPNGDGRVKNVEWWFN